MSKAIDEREKDEFGRIKNYPLGNYSEYAKDGKELNYLGYFKKYVGKKGQKDCFSYDWETGTFNDYISNYLEKKILKCVNLDKPLSEFTAEDGEEYLSKIRNLKDKEEKETFRRCRQLFWDVYSEAVKHGDFADALFWKKSGAYTDEEEDREELSKSRNLIRKSFSFREEIQLVDYFKNLNPTLSDGEDYGVLLMFCLGLRNAEAAGVSFDNIYDIPEKGFSVLYIIKTTEGDSNIVKVGGKTYNAARILPIYPFLLTVLNERKNEIIKNLVSKGNSLEEAEREVLRYPIACKGLDFSSRCTRNDISNRARGLFGKCFTVNQDSEDLQTQFAALNELQQSLKKYNIEEKDPTAYLCRRNQATHLYCLGLSASQIQYYIGHEVEDDNELRSYFVNPDRLQYLYTVMLKHPFCYLFGDVAEEEIITIKPQTTNYIRIMASEPGQEITLNVREGVNHDNYISVLQSDVPLGDSPASYIDIHRKSIEVYENYVSKMKGGVTEETEEYSLPSNL